MAFQLYVLLVVSQARSLERTAPQSLFFTWNNYVDVKTRAIQRVKAEFDDTAKVGVAILQPTSIPYGHLSQHRGDGKCACAHAAAIPKSYCRFQRKSQGQRKHLQWRHQNIFHSSICSQPDSWCKLLVALIAPKVPAYYVNQRVPFREQQYRRQTQAEI